jgi:hypothetical protein
LGTASDLYGSLYDQMLLDDDFGTQILVTDDCGVFLAGGSSRHVDQLVRACEEGLKEVLVSWKKDGLPTGDLARAQAWFRGTGLRSLSRPLGAATQILALWAEKMDPFEYFAELDLLEEQMIIEAGEQLLACPMTQTFLDGPDII